MVEKLFLMAHETEKPLFLKHNASCALFTVAPNSHNPLRTFVILRVICVFGYEQRERDYSSCSKLTA